MRSLGKFAVHLILVLESQFNGDFAFALATPSAVGPRHCGQLSKSLPSKDEANENRIAVNPGKANRIKDSWIFICPIGVGDTWPANELVV